MDDSALVKVPVEQDKLTAAEDFVFSLTHPFQCLTTANYADEAIFLKEHLPVEALPSAWVHARRSDLAAAHEDAIAEKRAGTILVFIILLE